MLELIAEVLVNRPSKHLNKTFSYKIPLALKGIGAGWRCVVPFAGKSEDGVIISCHEEESENISYRLLEIQSVLEPYPWFTEEMFETARWISRYYMCTFIEALRLFFIDKKGIRVSVYFQINWDKISEDDYIRQVIDTSVACMEDIDALRILGDERVKAYLCEEKFKKIEEVSFRHKRPLDRWIALSGVVDNPKRRGERQKALREHLEQVKTESVARLTALGFSAAVIRHFCESGEGRYFYKSKETFSLVSDHKEYKNKVLSNEQQNAVAVIEEAIDSQKYEGILLHGVTGSGKTEVYLRAAEHAVHNGGSVLIEVPEIALTDQMVSYFADYFGHDVVFMHSRLSKGERYNNRRRILNGESHIIIGSRSALFMPFKNLKLIIVDEEYDSSYKQSDGPRYNGRDVAKMMSVIYQCPIILGAATPSIETYFAAQQEKIKRVEMRSRIHHTPLPRIHVYDMKEGNEGTDTYISRPLLALLKSTIAENKKAILLLNRRGFAPVIMCKKCGYVFKCPHCDISLVYHKAQNRLKCHYCENSYPVPQECPVCGHRAFSYLGWGTQRIEDELAEILPNAKCCRFDIDSTLRKNSASKILTDFRNGEFDILFGTQMVAKGHDIPDVQAVGILSVDSTLNLPTYLAAEQAFNLITQCAGRAGRGKEQGEVILQTYNAGHYAIQAAAKQDYEAFYRKELEYRKILQYPPFTKLMKVTCFSKKSEAALKQADRIYDWFCRVISSNMDGICLTPPYEEPIKRVRDVFYISIMIKGKNLSSLKMKMRDASVFHENAIIIDVDPI